MPADEENAMDQSVSVSLYMYPLWISTNIVFLSRIVFHTMHLLNLAKFRADQMDVIKKWLQQNWMPKYTQYPIFVGSQNTDNYLSCEILGCMSRITRQTDFKRVTEDGQVTYLQYNAETVLTHLFGQM